VSVFSGDGLKLAIAKTASARHQAGMLAWVRRVVERTRRKRDDAGAAGERLAADWLRSRGGIRILSRNWRAPHDRRLELDLVAIEGEALVFVEVKSRPAQARVPGYFAATTRRKKRALLGAARAYIAGLRTKPLTVRFDVVEVVTGGPEPEVRHFANVPLFPDGFLRGL
jgi:putative endonuclease